MITAVPSNTNEATATPHRRRLPLAIKIGFSIFIAIFVPVYWREYGPANFLWLCDLGNFILLVALWRESALLVSSQAVGVLVVQTLWCADFLGGLLFGVHPFGGTQYMWSEEIPIAIRSISLFHFAVPPLLVFAVKRLGYDRRGLALQAVLCWLVLPVSFFFTDPGRNLNWVWRPFEREQSFLPPLPYLFTLMLAYVVVLYIPTHLALDRMFGRQRQA